jgi:hypothetical protein
LNKLAVLAFSLLIFFSTMLWYLANGSLNEYLKSQVLLQSQYYSGQNALLLNANYTADKGQTTFEQFSISNLNGLSQPQLLTLDKVIAQLAQVASTRLNSPSLQNKNITVLNIEKLTLGKLHVWSEQTIDGKNNFAVLLKRVSEQLALDYPALYPNISAKLYAKEHPELDASEDIAYLEKQTGSQPVETNKAVIAAKEAKQKKLLLGKAQTRALITSIVIEELKLTTIENNKSITKNFSNIELGQIGDENGLDSNQLGGE